MSYLKIEQNTPEWWAYKVGKISGTRFGQLISSRENSLIEELADEIMNGYCEISDFEDEDIIFGKENESIAIDLYEEKSGLKFERGGVLQSDVCKMHMASPDAINYEKGIVVEVKCTRHGKTHLKRFYNGIESNYKPQIINYFAVDTKINEVHFISYCPYRIERPLVVQIIKRDTEIYNSSKKKETVQNVCDNTAFFLSEAETNINDLIEQFKNIEF